MIERSQGVRSLLDTKVYSSGYPAEHCPRTVLFPAAAHSFSLFYTAFEVVNLKWLFTRNPITPMIGSLSEEMSRSRCKQENQFAAVDEQIFL